MVWKLLRLPRLSLPRWTGGTLARKLIYVSLLGAAMFGAFYLGRSNGLGPVRGQAPADSLLDQDFLRKTTRSDAKGHVVAYICGNVPITREELGDYLVDRLGSERVDFLVNRRIIERACADKNIQITEAEINAQLEEDLKAFNCTANEFVNNILRRYNKTMFEWREDVIRPKLALQRYVRPMVTIGDGDIRKAFEAKFGPKVECRIIMLTEQQRKDKDVIWQRASKSFAEFEKCAKEQQMAQFASVAGKIPPIHKHFPNPNIEEEAFKLQKGETSPLIDMPDGSMVILHCVQRIDADTMKSFDQERMALYNVLFEGRLNEMMSMVFNDLRRAAAPQIFLRRENPSGGSSPIVAAQPTPMPPPPMNLSSVTEPQLPAVPGSQSEMTHPDPSEVLPLETPRAPEPSSPPPEEVPPVSSESGGK